MEKNKSKKNQQNKNVEFANEFVPNKYLYGLGRATRNLVKVAEQELARETGNDPTPDENSINK